MAAWQCRECPAATEKGHNVDPGIGHRVPGDPYKKGGRRIFDKVFIEVKFAVKVIIRRRGKTSRNPGKKEGPVQGRPTAGREDFPDRDDDNWLKHTLSYLDGDSVRIEYKPVDTSIWEPQPRTY